MDSLLHPHDELLLVSVVLKLGVCKLLNDDDIADIQDCQSLQANYAFLEGEREGKDMHKAECQLRNKFEDCVLLSSFYYLRSDLIGSRKNFGVFVAEFDLRR
ncbi:hypothetical protein L1887_14017 [Cichorium endivia]|nr:hypothetical protein L1887_14017 [Cichorium endivia]